jgi:glycosyltransferase 2 family protein
VSRARWARVRLLGGLTVLGVLLWRVGTGPFLDGVRTVDGRTIAVGAVLGVPTTLCCAWRWRLVARGLGVHLGLPSAVAAYYRSQFLNTALPGGVLGDVHRGLRHGREAGDTALGIRAVFWERVAGQVVQVAATVAALLLLASPAGSALPAVGVAAGLLCLAGVLVALLVARGAPRTGTGRWARAATAVRSDLRSGLLSPATWPGLVVASAGALVGHVVTFLVAAHAAGVTASPTRLVPLALLVLLAMAVPVNVAGWGPREGAAAWAFAAAGLGAGQGVATAVVYGMMVLVAGLPGAAVLLVPRLPGLVPRLRRDRERVGLRAARTGGGRREAACG